MMLHRELLAEALSTSGREKAQSHQVLTHRAMVFRGVSIGRPDRVIFQCEGQHFSFNKEANLCKRHYAKGKKIRRSCSSTGLDSTYCINYDVDRSSWPIPPRIRIASQIINIPQRSHYPAPVSFEHKQRDWIEDISSVSSARIRE